MRVSLLTDGIFPYVIGGMQKHSYYLAKYLAASGVQVDLYHTNQSKYDIEKLELFSAEEKKNIRSFVVSFPQAGKLPGHYIKASYSYSEKIFEVLKAQAPTDFIYAKGFSAWKLLEEKQKGFSSAPVGVNFHGYEMFQPAPDLKSRLAAKFILRKPVQYNMRHAGYLFSYGGKITNLLKTLGVPDNKIIEIPTGIEESWLNRAPLQTHTPRKFVFVGRYERRKGIEELTAALKIMNGTPDFEFHFIGPIPEDKRLESSQIIYHGPITDTSRMQQLLRSCDVLVCPSHSEGMPNVILEAMASGLAIIATDVGAVQKMVRPENGVFIEAGDSKSVMAGISFMCSLPEKELLRKKEASIQLVENEFLWTAIARQTITAIQAKLN
jgi:glycosyltransferase involved in cell wall biosynthesis